MHCSTSRRGFSILDYGFWIRPRDAASHAFILDPSPFTLHPSNFKLHPSLFQLPRPGLSLLEVLVALFILSFGLLGVAMLLPAGTVTLRETAKLDRGAALGRAAMREVKVRQYADPWWYRGPGDVDFDRDVPRWIRPLDGGQWAPFGHLTQFPEDSVTRPVLIDPLYVARHTGSSDLWRFPLVGQHTMPRATINLRQSPGPPYPMRYGVAERFFMCQDDLEFDTGRSVLGETRDERPWGLYLFAAGFGSAFDPANAGQDALRREVEGNYSWMFMLQPRQDGYGETAGQYNLSAIVFYKRDLLAPEDVPERPVQTVFLSDGYGGGDVVLAAPPALGTNDREDAAAHLALRRNEWMMVYQADGNNIVRASWYRVINIEPDPVYDTVPGIDEVRWHRYATLAGPDWPSPAVAGGVLMRGVAGVYSKVIEVEKQRLR